jgi:WD40 repeat protein
MLASADVKDICIINTNDYSSVISKGRWCYHLQRITCLAWAWDNKFLASGGADDSIYIWSIENKMKRIHYPYAHRGGLTGLSFLHKVPGLQLLSAGRDSVVNRWNVTNDAKEKFGYGILVE